MLAAVLCLPAGAQAQPSPDRDRAPNRANTPGEATGAPPAWTVPDTFDATIYVEPDHPRASDRNIGTAEMPLKSLQGGIFAAVQNKRDGYSTRVVIAPGTYRERLNMETYTNWQENQPDNEAVMLFEAREPGTVILSGSDEWADGWTLDPHANAWVHDWPYVWGVSPNPWQGYRELAEISRRREMIFLDGQPLQQVLSKRDLVAGTFFVDEQAERLMVLPPEKKNFESAKKEVGVREKLIWIEYEHNVAFRGLVFEHAVTRWADAWAAVRVSGGQRVRFEDCEFRHNNGLALYLGESMDMQLDGVRSYHNGWDGWGTWKVKGFRAEDTQTSFNNWRGGLGEFHGWAVGNKIESTHDITIRRHRSFGNQSRGLWFDLDVRNVILDEVMVKHNYGDGIWFEASPGPVTVMNSTICRNEENGFFTTYSEGLTLTGNTFYENKRAQVALGGEGTRYSPNYLSGGGKELSVQDFTLRGNVLAGGKALVDAQAKLGSEEWAEISYSFTSEDNKFYHAKGPNQFRVTDSLLGQLSFSEWQTRTGDTGSTFASVMITDPCQ